MSAVSFFYYNDVALLPEPAEALTGGNLKKDQADNRGNAAVGRLSTGGEGQEEESSRVWFKRVASYWQIPFFKERLCWSCCPRFHIYGKCLKSSGDFLIYV